MGLNDSIFYNDSFSILTPGAGPSTQKTQHPGIRACERLIAIPVSREAAEGGNIIWGGYATGLPF
jgi:hypothetical protein